MMERLMVNGLFMGFFCYSVFFTFESVLQSFLLPLFYEACMSSRYEMATREQNVIAIINTLQVRMDLEAATRARSGARALWP